MATPLHMWTDGDPSRNPEGTTRFALNANIDVKKQTFTQEEAFELITSYNPNLIPMGFCNLPNKEICIFSKVTNQLSYASEIGILSESGQYRIILRDNLSDAPFNFDEKHLIKAVSKQNINGEIIVYFVDGNNFDKYLNVSELNVAIDTEFKILNKNELQLMTLFKINSSANIYLDEVISGGNLESGVYYVGIRQSDDNGNTTQIFNLSNPISIVDGNGSGFGNNYDGCPPGTPTGKGISILVFDSDLNPSYKFIEIIIVKKVNQVITSYILPKITYSGNNFSYSILSLNNALKISNDSIINDSGYITSKAITQLDNVLYKGNLKSNKNYNLQPYVNRCKINYITEEKNIGQTADNYRNPLVIFEDKSFMWDEVYALYVSFEIETEHGLVETEAYHIPGRPVADVQLIFGTTVKENTKITSLPAVHNFYDTDQTSFKKYYPGTIMAEVNPNAKVFHAFDTSDNPNALTNMGYWENENEKYSNDEKWLIKDENDNVIGDLRNQNVRHHKFPESNPTRGLYHPTDANKVNVLGVELSNLRLPSNLNVKKVKIYYAKRDMNNRTILGQSLNLPGCGIGNQSQDFGINIFGGVGNILFVSVNRSTNTSTNSLVDFIPLSADLTNLYNSLGQFIGNYAMLLPSKKFDVQSEDIGYFKFKPFDLLSQDVSVSSASYIKNIYRIKGKYLNVLSENPSPPKNFSMNFEFNILKNYNGVDKGSLVVGTFTDMNKYRRITAIDYIQNNSPAGKINSILYSSPFDFRMYPNNGNGEKFILCETDGMIQIYNGGPTTPPPNPDYAYATLFQRTTSPFFGPSNFNLNNRAAPYLSNICAFKSDIFLNFDLQTLCYTGKAHIYQPNVLQEYSVFGADTFTSYYGEKSQIGFGENIMGDVETSTSGEQRDFAGFRSIHYYICQSTSNINYRHEGDNYGEIYFPKSDALEVLRVDYPWDNWYGYNVDYSSVNDILQPNISLKSNRNSISKFPNRIIRSAVNNPEALSDNYLIWEAGNEIDWGVNKGEINDLNSWNNQLYIQTEQGIFVTIGRQVLKTNNSESYVGAGDIFENKPIEIVSTDGIYGGTHSRFVTTASEYGLMFPDVLSGRVFNVQGNQLDEISKNGKEVFFREHLPFKLPSYLDTLTLSLTPQWNIDIVYTTGFIVKFNNEIYRAKLDSVNILPTDTNSWEKLEYRFKNTQSILDKQSIGVECVFDYKYRRYILTKKDYTYSSDFEYSYKGYYNSQSLPGFIYLYEGVYYELYEGEPPVGGYDIIFAENRYGVEIDFDDYLETNGFTVAYYPELKGWVSFYSYYPKRFHSNFNTVLSFNERLHKHNSPSGFLMYYNNTLHSTVIDYVTRYPQVNRLSTVMMKTVCYDRNVNPNQITPNVLKYNKTFNRHLVYDSYQCSLEQDIFNLNNTRNNEGYWLLNNFRDYVLDNSQAYFELSSIYPYYIPNSNVSPTKHWSKLKKFNDYWFVNRFIYNNTFDTISLQTRYIGDNRFVLSLSDKPVGSIIKLPDNRVFRIIAKYYIGSDLITEVEWYTDAPAINTLYSSYSVLNNDRLELHDIQTINFKTIR